MQESYSVDKEKLKEFLTAAVGEENFSMDPAVLYAFSADVSRYECMPDAVVRPATTEQVSEIVKFCNENKVPVIPAGNRTGASGGTLAVYGGIILDLTSMNKIFDVDTDNLQVGVEPGVIHAKLNQFMEPYGFYFPVAPGSGDMCTIGGMVGNNASGTKAVKYGVTGDYVLKMEVVLPDGRIMIVGSKALKHVAGLDLIGLLVGSEGVLGVFTKIWLKLIPLPETSAIITATYDVLENAGQTVVETFKAGIIPAAVEILDRSSIYAINAYKPEMNLPDVEAMLLYEVEGSPQEIEQQGKTLSELCKRNGAVNTDFATDPEEKTKLWQARKLVGAASVRVRKGYARVYAGEDITVPIPRIPEMLTFLREASQRYDFPIVTFGHIGDGNLHPAITIQKDVAEDWPKLEALVEEIHQKALEMGGSVTGEHGIGVARAKYLPQEFGDVAVDVMKTIKRALDPNYIMNPGKMGLDKDPEEVLRDIPIHNV